MYIQWCKCARPCLVYMYFVHNLNVVRRLSRYAVGRSTGCMRWVQRPNITGKNAETVLKVISSKPLSPGTHYHSL
jgi:hypothetical protein